MLKSILRKSARRIAAPAAAAILLALAAPSASAMDPILPFAEVQQGMEGTAYTVVDSSREIRTFGVEVINGIARGKGEQPLIMARAYGPVVEAAGGILQGMSGSPVYVDGRLIGAVALGYKDMTPYTFFITPIEEMMKLWTLPDEKNKTHLKGFDLKKYQEDRAKEAEKEAKEQKEEGAGAKAEESGAAQAAEKAAVPAQGADAQKPAKPGREEKPVKEEAPARAETHAKDGKPAQAEQPAGEGKPAKGASAAREEKPAKGEKPAKEAKPAKETGAGASDLAKDAAPKDVLYLSGFTAAGADFLQSKLPLANVALMPAAVPAGAYEHTSYGATLLPGSSVGVAVAYGDFAISGVGTVTAVDGRKILAFGHSFLHRGNVNYFMTDADVYGTIAGVSAGMKVAGIGSLIGRINQDREAGIAGILGEYPSVVPVRVHVKDETLGRTAEYASTVAYDEDLLPTLASVIAYGAIAKTSDTVSGATADVKFSIRTNVAEGGLFERQNMFYSAADVGQIAVGELMQAVTILCSNTEEESDILDVQVDVTMEGARRTASIVSAVPDKKTVRPGDTVNFTTTIKPYRKEKETLIIPYKVPESQTPGTLYLDVRGGGFVPMVSPLLILAQAGAEVASDAPAAASTADQLKELSAASRNNVITIASGAPAQPLSEKEKRRMAEEAKRAAEAAKEEQAAHKVTLLAETSAGEKAGETNFATDYIIDNVVRTTLTVERR